MWTASHTQKSLQTDGGNRNLNGPSSFQYNHHLWYFISCQKVGEGVEEIISLCTLSTLLQSVAHAAAVKTIPLLMGFVKPVKKGQDRTWKQI